MNIVDVEPGKAVLEMPIKKEKHTNLYKAVHGGALASLADTAMGIACVSTNSKVVTIDMNINYIKNINAGGIARAKGVVVHRGRRTFVAECDIVDENQQLLVKSRGTFFNHGPFEDFPVWKK